ncbi:phosphoribosylglycinamide synthetase C domain-containing protein [Paraflavitalea speifideaquila]|uniref:phosphoribosylglycinamide synthetase C domain-containing protein n=1 Tax=Paraflavitalea speifideaquila TaxID=3076558 RepID=UPI0028E27616|nr:phosphoribosylglycinamide synthetase C domain-containing protein [Paraflavitalea speifideiaquila]
MAVSGGYPGSYEKGYPINGLNQSFPADSMVFHAGTVPVENEVLTSGGRVLCVTSFDHTISGAVNKSKKVLQQISFEDMYYRKDIGYEFSE